MSSDLVFDHYPWYSILVIYIAPSVHLTSPERLDFGSRIVHTAILHAYKV